MVDKYNKISKNKFLTNDKIIKAAKCKTPPTDLRDVVIGREESVDQRPDSQLEGVAYELGKPEVKHVSEPSRRCSEITDTAL